MSIPQCQFLHVVAGLASIACAFSDGDNHLIVSCSQCPRFESVVDKSASRSNATPANNAREPIAWGKSNSSKTCRTGPGSPSHIATAYFQTATGARGAIGQGPCKAPKSRDREVVATIKAAESEAD